jgi:hypothetical protein
MLMVYFFKYIIQNLLTPCKMHFSVLQSSTAEKKMHFSILQSSTTEKKERK